MIEDAEITEKVNLFKEEEVAQKLEENKKQYEKVIEELMEENKSSREKKTKAHENLFLSSLILNAGIILFLYVNKLVYPFFMEIFTYFEMDGMGIAKVLISMIGIMFLMLVLVYRYSKDVTIPFIEAGLLNKKLLVEWDVSNKINFVKVTSKKKMGDMGLWKTKNKLYTLLSRNAAVNLPHNVPSAVVLSEYGAAIEPAVILEKAPYFDPVSIQSYADITEADAMESMSGGFDFRNLIYIGILVLLMVFAWNYYQTNMGCATSTSDFLELAKTCGQNVVRGLDGGTPL